MTELVFFLEEQSAKEMLKGLLPRLLPPGVTTRYVVFEGKQDLEKRLPIKLRVWQVKDAKFVVMRDQDSGNCVSIKQTLIAKCTSSGKPDTLIRIACHELETFYLGDLKAVESAIGPANIGNKQKKAKYRYPDKCQNPYKLLKELSPDYQKIAGSRAIGPYLDINCNKSKSFKALISGITNLVVRPRRPRPRFTL